MDVLTVVVDDSELDRYMVRRFLSRHESFGEVLEATSGSEFLEQVVPSGQLDSKLPKPVLVLMDINMPGLDGFETAEELQAKVETGHVPDSLVVMMFTSSDNPRDRQRAEEIDIVKGYIVKPLDEADITYLKSLYEP
jgi:CheY-like chemotaxis protein